MGPSFLHLYLQSEQGDSIAANEQESQDHLQRSSGGIAEQSSQEHGLQQSCRNEPASPSDLPVAADSTDIAERTADRDDAVPEVALHAVEPGEPAESSPPLRANATASQTASSSGTPSAAAASPLAHSEDKLKSEDTEPTPEPTALLEAPVGDKATLPAEPIVYEEQGMRTDLQRSPQLPESIEQVNFAVGITTHPR